MRKKKPKVLVAMSGGVDSSVAAFLLLQKGYDVTGAYMRQWTDKKEGDNVCTWKQDRRDALRVAAHLGIPLLTLDFEKEYREWVLKYMLKEYQAGRTPNPDVLCNKHIKFGYWLKHAKEMGFDFLATGHYARISRITYHVTRNKVNFEEKKLIRDTGYVLREAKDTNKDQTYFLHKLNQEQLRHTLFPIGHLTKPEVRKIAKKAKLPTAERAESMGICFVGEVPMREFLKNKIKTKKGKIVMLRPGSAQVETVVGEHEGLAFYTIGQRHNLGNFRFQILDFRLDNTPLFVVDKRVKTNELVVGYENDPLLYKKEVTLDDVHWVSGQEPEFPLECKVRLRHRQPMQNAECRIRNRQAILTFKNPQKAVTPGQFAVLYKNGVCLGGGVIV